MISSKDELSILKYRLDRLGGEMGTGWFFIHDKASIDIFCLRDESLEWSDNPPDPDVLTRDGVEDLEATLEPVREVAPISTARAIGFSIAGLLD